MVLRLDLVRGRRGLALQQAHHLLVGEAAADADGALGEAHRRPLALRRQVEEDALDVAHPALLQAGGAIGDDLRKHRQDALRQVDARAALPRFAIHGAAGRGKMGHVSDMHPQLPMFAAAVVRQGDRIVKIAGVGWIDRNDDRFRPIFPALEILLVEGGRGFASLLQDVLRKPVG